MKNWKYAAIAVAALAVACMVFVISQNGDATHATAVVPAGQYAGQVPKDGTDGMDPRHHP